MKRARVFVVLGFIATFLPTASQAEAPSSGPQASKTVQRGALEIGAVAGYLQGNDTFTSDSSDRSAVYALPRIGMVVTPDVGSRFYRGNLEVLLEPFYARYDKPFWANAAGGSVLFKYNFLAFGRWMPYWDLGLGMLWTNLAPRIPEQSTQFNYLLESGPGVQYFVTDTVALTLGVRFHHISNGGLGDRNHGLNSTLGYVGVSFFLPR
jgi:lipid A 3-O-deacylase